MKTSETPQAGWRIFFGGLFLSALLALVDIRNLAEDKGFALTQPKWSLLMFVIAAVGFLAANFFLRAKFFGALDDFLVRISRRAAFVYIAGCVFLFSLFFLPAFTSYPYVSSLFGGRLWVKSFLFLMLVFFGAILLRVVSERWRKIENSTWTEAFLFASLAYLLIYQLYLASLYITDYPFAIGWTRDSRYYYASLFFAEKLYGKKLPLPILHPSLHFILSFPYLFGKLPLWAHRAWSVFLTLGLSAALAFVSVKKLDVKRRVFFGVWVFLFLLQGSIYAHLLIPALIVFLFATPAKPKRTLFAVLFASAWAGVSRINWFPVPSVLAALIYFVETPPKGKTILRYFARPALCFLLGTGTAFSAQALYIRFSGNGGREAFFTSLSSDLLWNRLLPNATYSLGILWGAFLLSVPLLLLLFSFFKAWRPLQRLGVFAVVATLFLGGLLVSVKIGGGADLHNMDAYFVSVLLIGSLGIARGVRLDSVFERRWAEALFAAALLLGWFILHGSGSRAYDRAGAEATLNDLQVQVTRVSEAGDEVLFVSQRHLLAVGLVNLPLVPEYEKDVVMEMVMAKNRAYLDGFYDDLRHQRFGMIVIDPQKDSLVGKTQAFGAENNKWVLKVTRPLWCYYELWKSYPQGIELYVPRRVPQDCQ